MATNVSFAGSTYSIPNTAGENGWSSLSNFLIALANNSATTTTLTQTVRTATTTPVNVATTDFAVFTNMVSASAVSVVLPTGSTGRVFAIVDAKGDAGTNNVTISCSSGQLINGAATYILNEHNGGILVQFDGTGWRILAAFVGDSPAFSAVTVSGTATVGTLTATSATVGGAAVTTGSNTQTLTNKTIAAGSNTVSGLTNSNIDTAAAIARTKLASGTASRVLVNDGSGVMSEAAFLTTALGGTGLTSLGSALQVLRVNAGGTALEYAAAGGDFSGPASSTANAFVRFDGTGGKTGKNGTATETDDGALTVGPNGSIFADVFTVGGTSTNTNGFDAIVIKSAATGSSRASLRGTYDSTTFRIGASSAGSLIAGAAAGDFCFTVNNSKSFLFSGDGGTTLHARMSDAGVWRWTQYGTGLAHFDSSGNITSSAVVNADVSASAAIAHSKLADITAGSVLLGNASNVPTATALSGDVTVNSSGVTAIGSGVIVDADINASAAISGSKLQAATGSNAGAVTTAAQTFAGQKNISSGFYGNEPFVYEFSSWAAGGTAATTSVPTAGSTTVAGRDMSAGTISSGTQTFTFARAGYYLVTINVAHTHSTNFTYARMLIDLGGTATRAGNLLASSYIMAAESGSNQNGQSSLTFAVNPGASGTLTVKPTYGTDTAGNAAAGHVGYCSVVITPL